MKEEQKNYKTIKWALKQQIEKVTKKTLVVYIKTTMMPCQYIHLPNY